MSMRLYGHGLTDDLVMFACRAYSAYGETAYLEDPCHPFSMRAALIAGRTTCATLAPQMRPQSAVQEYAGFAFRRQAKDTVTNFLANTFEALSAYRRLCKLRAVLHLIADRQRTFCQMSMRLTLAARTTAPARRGMMKKRITLGALLLRTARSKHNAGDKVCAKKDASRDRRVILTTVPAKLLDGKFYKALERSKKRRGGKDDPQPCAINTKP